MKADDDDRLYAHWAKLHSRSASRDLWGRALNVVEMGALALIINSRANGFCCIDDESYNWYRIGENEDK